MRSRPRLTQSLPASVLVCHLGHAMPCAYVSRCVRACATGLDGAILRACGSRSRYAIYAPPIAVALSPTLYISICLYTYIRTNS